MVTRYLIGATPVQITTAGQSGAVWLSEKGDSENATEIFVYHNGQTIDSGKRVFIARSNSDILHLTADSGSDYFMAVSRGGAGHL
jgi:hypothetical protein